MHLAPLRLPRRASPRPDLRKRNCPHSRDTFSKPPLEDDLVIGGSWPCWLRVGQRWLIATSDPSVLIAKFRCPPFVQNLAWFDETGTLVLVQNITVGRGWRLTQVDLDASLQAGQCKVTSSHDFAPADELEGFCRLSSPVGGVHAIFVTSSGKNYVRLDVIDRPTKRPIR